HEQGAVVSACQRGDDAVPSWQGLRDGVPAQLPQGDGQTDDQRQENQGAGERLEGLHDVSPRVRRTVASPAPVTVSTPKSDSSTVSRVAVAVTVTWSPFTCTAPSTPSCSRTSWPAAAAANTSTVGAAPCWMSATSSCCPAARAAWLAAALAWLIAASFAPPSAIRPINAISGIAKVATKTAIASPRSGCRRTLPQRDRIDVMTAPGRCRERWWPKPPRSGCRAGT